MQRKYYVYIYLDPRKIGSWNYETISFFNEPFYVGMGQKGRMDSHLDKSRLVGHTPKVGKMKKILALGIEPVRTKLYECLTKEEAEDLEAKLISHFGRLDLKTGPLTNLTGGGKYTGKISSPTGKNKYTPNSKRVDQFDKQGNFIKKWERIKDIALETNIGPSAIYNCCLGKASHAGGFVWKFDGTSPYVPSPNSFKKSSVKKEKAKVIPRVFKKIFHYGSDGRFINEYSRPQEIPYFMFGLTNLESIYKCCRGTKRSYKGNRFFNEYQGDTIEPLKDWDYNRKVVQKLDYNGKVLEEFPSIKDAAIHLGVATKETKSKKLHNALRKAHERLTSFMGFLWKGRDVPFTGMPPKALSNTQRAA